MPEDFSTPPPPPPASAAPPYASSSAFAQPYGSPYPSYGRPPGQRHSGRFWFAIIGGSVAVVALFISLMVWSAVRGLNGDDSATIDGFGSSRIGVIDIDGVITNADKLDAQIRKRSEERRVGK